MASELGFSPCTCRYLQFGVNLHREAANRKPHGRTWIYLFIKETRYTRYRSHQRHTSAGKRRTYRRTCKAQRAGTQQVRTVTRLSVRAELRCLRDQAMIRRPIGDGLPESFHLRARRSIAPRGRGRKHPFGV